jgi:hypothetical protein
MMMQKMCKMMHIVVQVEKMLPISKSMIMLKKMTMISKKHQQLHLDDPAKTMFLPLATHHINVWCYYLMVQNLSVFQRQIKDENKEWNKAMQE